MGWFQRMFERRRTQEVQAEEMIDQLQEQSQPKKGPQQSIRPRKYAYAQKISKITGKPYRAKIRKLAANQPLSNQSLSVQEKAKFERKFGKSVKAIHRGVKEFLPGVRQPTKREIAIQKRNIIRGRLAQERYHKSLSGENIFDRGLQKLQQEEDRKHNRYMNTSFPRDFLYRKNLMQRQNLDRKRERERYGTLLNAHKHTLSPKQLWELSQDPLPPINLQENIFKTEDNVLSKNMFKENPENNIMRSDRPSILGGENNLKF